MNRPLTTLTRIEIHLQVSYFYNSCSFFPGLTQLVIRLVLLIIMVVRCYSKNARDKLVFVFLLFFPRRYRSGFTTR